MESAATRDQASVAAALVSRRSAGLISSALSPGTLHIMLGVVPTCVDEVKRCAKPMCASWLRELGVLRNDRHACADFIEPECKTIFDCVETLVNMTTEAALTKFKLTRADSTPDERRESAPAPPDPQEQKLPMPRLVLDRQVNVLQCCSDEQLQRYHAPDEG